MPDNPSKPLSGPSPAALAAFAATKPTPAGGVKPLQATFLPPQSASLATKAMELANSHLPPTLPKLPQPTLPTLAAGTAASAKALVGSVELADFQKLPTTKKAVASVVANTVYSKTAGALSDSPITGSIATSGHLGDLPAYRAMFEELIPIKDGKIIQPIKLNPRGMGRAGFLALVQTGFQKFVDKDSSPTDSSKQK